MRDLLAQGAAFEAGPLMIHGRDFEALGITSASVFDVCALARLDEDEHGVARPATPSVAHVASLLRRAFGARITDTTRPINARYGALHSWHKARQAVDFVPAAGVVSINRDQVRGLMRANGIRVIELLGPGDRGHANHWHVAFARSGRDVESPPESPSDADWIINVARARAPSPVMPAEIQTSPAAVLALRPPEPAPPQWDVFAAQGRGS